MARNFVNFTNHPSMKWGDAQREAAEKWGVITDVNFPNVPSSLDEEGISNLAEDCIERIMVLEPSAVLCQGEFTLAYRVISELKKRGVVVLAACSERMVVESGNKKEVTFEFVQFRKF